MVFTDWQIESAVESGDLGISPYRPEQVQPASYDVLLGPALRELLPGGAIDLAAVPGGHTRLVEIDPVEGYMLLPGGFVLGSTEESVRIPNQTVGRVEGKSSLGRLGLTVHITAGFIDPGFRGQITLEFKNDGPRPLILRPGLPVAQLTFESLRQTPKRVYGTAGNHYQDQSGPTESRYGM